MSNPVDLEFCYFPIFGGCNVRKPYSFLPMKWSVNMFTLLLKGSLYIAVV